MQLNDISVLNIPFSKLIRLEPSDREGYLFKINSHSDLLNHMETLHAGVLFTLAESTSGQYLLNEYGISDSNIVPVIRKAEIRYSKPGRGAAYANAELVNSSMEEIRHQLATMKRTFIEVRTVIVDEKEERLMTALFEWFVTVL